MKILLACEGQSEVYLLDSLINEGYLHFEYPLLLDRPIKLRQLKEIAPIINSLPIDEDIVVYRIGDTLKDKLDLSQFEMRRNHIKEIKICTKTELEILVIIKEDLYEEYLKSYKTIKPKAFVNQHIKDYDPKTYFENHDMISAIKEYKHLKKHRKDEKYLFDLIVKNNLFVIL